MTVFIIRHGATALNLEKPPRLQGRHDSELSSVGRLQALATSQLLAPVRLAAVISSPLRRAIDTAKSIAGAHALKVDLADELIEADVGLWEGMTWAMIEQRDWRNMRDFLDDPYRHGYPNGETHNDVASRALGYLSRFQSTNGSDDIALVTHNIVARVIVASLLRMPAAHSRRIVHANCGVTTLIVNNGEWHVNSLNSVFHLMNVPQC
jgi:broad specificity phosphatase PhoE